MRRLLVRAAAGLAAAAVVVVTAVPAWADLGDTSWERVPCTSGAIDRAELSEGGQVLTLEGHLDCADSREEPARYGYARYYGDKGMGVLSSPDLRPYAPTGPTVYATVANLVRTDFAVCVVTDYDVRVACVMVEGKRPATIVRPLPIDDPLVAFKVQVVPLDVMGSPACGGCW